MFISKSYALTHLRKIITKCIRKDEKDNGQDAKIDLTRKKLKKL